MLFAGENQIAVSEYSFRLLRQSGGAEVIVVRGQSKAGIPHAAAYGIDGKAGGFQSLHTLVYIIR
jgi:hypothetical protein